MTSGESATERATGSTTSSAPCTTIRPTRAEPSPSWTISSASWRSSASIASPSASSSGVCGSIRTPEAPFAIANTVSLVESCPSTEMRSNERFTQTPVSRSIVSASSPASVWMKQNIVAWRGEIIPAPFACAASRTDWPDGSATSRHARFGPASLVRIASEKSPASRRERAARRACAAHDLVARQLQPDHARGRDAHLVRLELELLGDGALHLPRGLEATVAVAHVRAARVGHNRTQAVQPSLLRGDHRRAHARVRREARRRRRLVERREHADVEPLRLDARGDPRGAEALGQLVGIELRDVVGLLDPA